MLMRKGRRPTSARQACARPQCFGRGAGGAAEVGGREIEVGQVDHLERAEPDALQRVGERGGVAHEDDGQPIGPEILPRDTLDVVRP